MATYRTDTVTFTTASGTKTATITTVAGDYLLAVVYHSQNTSSHAVTDDQGGTWTELTVFAGPISTNASNMSVWVRDQLVVTGTSTIVSTAPGTSTGGGLNVFAVAGMSRAGVSGVRQFATQPITTAATPAPVFSVAPLTANVIIGAVTEATNPPALTARTSFTERQDIGYATPNRGLHSMTRNSGETATTQTWGSATANAFASVVVELDTSATTTTVAVGVATATNTAEPVARRKTKVLGTATETDSLVAVTRSKSKALGIATETDTAEVIVRAVPLRENTAEGTNGVTVSTSNSAGPDQFTAIANDASLTYDSSQKYEGSTSILSDTTGGGVQANVRLDMAADAATSYHRFWLRIPTGITWSTNTIFRVQGSGGVSLTMRLLSTRMLRILDGASAVTDDTTTAVPLDQWVRVELDVTHHTSAGAATLRLYTTPGSNTAADTVSFSSANTRAFGSYDQLGIIASSNNKLWIDHPQVSLSPLALLPTIVALGTATETDSLVAVARSKSKTLGTATETDAAFAAPRGLAITVALGTAIETDSLVAASGTSAVDDFNRADSASLGANWTQDTDHSIASNRLAVSNAAQRAALWATPAVTNDHYAEAASYGVLEVGVIVRSNGVTRATISGYVGRWNSDTACRLYRLDSNVGTLLGQQTGLTRVDGDVLRLVAEGDELRLYLNGTLIITTTDSTYQTNKNFGVYTTTNTDTIDNFVGGDINALARRKSKALGTATETDSLVAVTRRKTKALGTATETDAAFAAPRRLAITVALGTATETDSLVAVARRKTKTLGTATETDSLVAVTRRRIRALGVTTETDSLVALARRKSKALGTATETDSLVAVTRRKSKALGTATETDSLVAVTRRKSKALGTATETDAAQAITRRSVMGTAIESDSVIAVGRRKVKALGVALEADTVLPISRRGALGTPVETDTGQPLSKRKIKALGTATETNTAVVPGFIGRIKRRALGTATESNSAIAVSRARKRALGTATEADQALSIVRLTLLSTALESSTALPVTRRKVKSLGTATESDTALPVAVRGILGAGAESDSALTVSRQKRKALGFATETDTALPVTALLQQVVGLATEIDSAVGATRRKVRSLGMAVEVGTPVGVALVKRKTLAFVVESETAFGVGRTSRHTLGTVLETDAALPVTAKQFFFLRNVTVFTASITQPHYAEAAQQREAASGAGTRRSAVAAPQAQTSTAPDRRNAEAIP